MQLSEIKNYIYFFTGTDSDSFEDPDISRSINRWYRRVATWIWEATGTWEYDDTSKSNLPVGTTDLASDQDTYQLPSTAQRIIDVEIKDSGDWNDLEEIDKSQMNVAPSEYYDDNGTPVAYDTLSNVIVLYPAPDENVTDGLRIHISREVDKLSNSTDEPGFNEQFHDILAYGAAHDWAAAYGDEGKEVEMRRMIFGSSNVSGYKDDLKAFYGRHNRDTKNRMGLKPIPFD